MNVELENFYEDIPNKQEITSSEMILYFIYFFSKKEEYEYVSISQIMEAYKELGLKPYSNVSAFLNRKAKGKNSAVLKDPKKGYKLARIEKQKFEKIFEDDENIKVTKELFDISIIDQIPNVPYYIKKIAEQMCACYDKKLYTACFAMIRKLIETLIIECFERYSIEDNIKDNNGEFYYLNFLIDRYIISKKWNASRNINNSFKQIKKYGDLSVHNRRFFATKNDIDNMKDEIRQSVQEIILTIDYPNWQR